MVLGRIDLAHFEIEDSVNRFVLILVAGGVKLHLACFNLFNLANHLFLELHVFEVSEYLLARPRTEEEFGVRLRSCLM